MKIVVPAHNEPVSLPDGSMNPIWYQFFTNLARRGVLDLPDVDNSTPIANTQTIRWNAAAMKFKPGA